MGYNSVAGNTGLSSFV